MRGMRFVVLCSAALLLGGAQWSRADEIAHATARVFVRVEPSITVLPSEPIIDLGSIQTGIISGQIPFRVESNSQTVRFSAMATPLFKGGRTGTSNLAIVPSIPISRESGVRVHADHANPVGGEDDVVDYVAQEENVGGLFELTTQSVEFESSQNNRFDQAVSLQVTWIQDDPQKPMGEYSGSVVLWAMVPPTDFPSGSPGTPARAGRR